MVGKMRGKTLVIDTYAIIADLTGTISPKARRALDLVRIGEADGIIHFCSSIARAKSEFSETICGRRGDIDYSNEVGGSDCHG